MLPHERVRIQLVRLVSACPGNKTETAKFFQQTPPAHLIQRRQSFRQAWNRWIPKRRNAARIRRPVEQAHDVQQIQLRPLAKLLGERGHHAAGVFAFLHLHIGQIGDL